MQKHIVKYSFTLNIRLKTCLSLSLLLLVSLLFESCSQGAIPGGGNLGSAAPSGVIQAPNDEIPLVTREEGLVRAPVTGASQTETVEPVRVTYSGASN